MKPSADIHREPRAETTPACFALVFVATLLFQLPYFDRWYAFLDEGHIVMFADIVARGGEIYRDATIYPLPGAFYLLAQFFEWFGPSIRLSRLLVVFEFSLFVPLVFLWMRKLVPAAWAWLAVAVLWMWRVWSFPHWQMYSYSTTCLLFLLGSSICLLRVFQGASARWLHGAGLLFGMGVACKQDYGAAMLLAACATLAVWSASRMNTEAPGPGRVLLGFILPGALVGGVLGAYFLAKGILPDLVQMTIFNHVVGLQTFAYPEIPRLLPLFGQDPGLRDPVGFFNYFPGLIFTVDSETVRESFLFRETGLLDFLVKAFFYGPHAIALIGALRLMATRHAIRDADRREAYFAELMLYTFAFGMWLVLSFNKPQDYVHFAVVYWPYLMLGIIYVRGALGAASKPIRVAGFAAVFAGAVPGIALSIYGLSLLAELRATRTQPVESPRAGIYASETEARVLDEIVRYVQANTRPEEKVAVLPYFPIVQFLMDRLGPHRSAYIVWPFPEFEDRDQRIIRALEADDTEVVIYNFTQFVNFPFMSEFAPELFAYLVDHYSIDRVFSYDHSGYMLAALRRERGTKAGEPVVGDPQRQGDLWIEHEIGPREPLPPAARASVIDADRWPFRPAVAVLPALAPERTVFSVELSLPSDGPRLESAFGVNPRAWFMHPPSAITYRMDLIDQAGIEHLLIERTLDPHKQFDQRGWSDFEVDLSAWAGQKVRLQLSTSTQREEGRTIWVGGFALPRVVGTGSAT